MKKKTFAFLKRIKFYNRTKTNHSFIKLLSSHQPVSEWKYEEWGRFRHLLLHLLQVELGQAAGSRPHRNRRLLLVLRFVVEGVSLFDGPQRQVGGSVPVLVGPTLRRWGHFYPRCWKNKYKTFVVVLLSNSIDHVALKNSLYFNY